MRIITSASKKDFYDRFSNPTDRHTVWVRTPVAYAIHDPRVANLERWVRHSAGSRRMGGDKGPPVLTVNDTLSRQHGVESANFMVGGLTNDDMLVKEAHYYYQRIVFCGRMYHGIGYEERRTTKAHPHSMSTEGRIRWYWNADTFFADHEMHRHKRWEIFQSETQQVQSQKRWEETLRNYFAVRTDTSIANTCIDLNTPVLVRRRTDDAGPHDSESWIANDLIGHFQFIRAMPPHLAFQELEMFVGGVLVRPEKTEPVSDKIKVQAHGMDERSFRKDPTKVHHD